MHSVTRVAPRQRVLLVDLNNFARFPTLSVGILVAALREAGRDVEVLSPLAVGVQGLARPAEAPAWGYWDERLRWWSATTPSRAVRRTRDLFQRLRPHRRGARSERLQSAVRCALERRPDVVMVSAYLMYRDAIEEIAREAEGRDIPVIVGGPAFQDPATRRDWLSIPGVTALFAGEADRSIAQATDAVLGRAEPPPGLSIGEDRGIAEPLGDLDAIPFPDYADFPWERYPNRIVSMLSGRGCGWGVCRFCSDVHTVAGRSFRSRSLDNVVAELAHHRERHDVELFCFSDLKLNSDLDVWRGLHERFQSAVPGAQWTCAVHVGPRKDEGLTRADLARARAAGLRRVTTGLESGSQRVLDAMRKGTRREAIEDFLAGASEAGISTRVTAFTGYPGEGPGDVAATTEQLRRVGRFIDRVHLSRLSIQSGTPLQDDLDAGRLAQDGIESLGAAPGEALTPHLNRATESRAYRREIARLLREVHAINRRPIRHEAAELEGVM